MADHYSKLPKPLQYIIVRDPLSFDAGGVLILTNAYVAVTTTYAVLTTDFTVECTSGTFTVTLPTAVGVTGQVYNIKNSGSGTITVATTSAQTIDGATTQVITDKYTNLTVQSNGTNWIIL